MVMKRLITVIIILSLITALGVFELVHIQSVLNNLGNRIESLHQKVISNEGNIDIFTEEILELKSYWIEREEYICLMFNHKDLLPITESITRASANIKNNNYDDTIIELNLLEEYAKNSAHIMDFHINNIL